MNVVGIGFSFFQVVSFHAASITLEVIVLVFPQECLTQKKLLSMDAC